ncbi:MAG TPA: HlyC/CorC family transporter [Gammaproteobacteria bacterium]|nr:HlyC/CorC family transporter [Gammaproteobacteria bacterium]
MQDIPLSMMAGVLVLMLVLSAFFSGSETALMTLNRYRMRHLARAGHRGAILAERLLRQPDRLIGLILLGNNLANVTASMLNTLIALRLFGEDTLAIATGILTLLILIFSEVAPKTLAALRPELLAYPAAFVYWPLLKVTYPLVWSVNFIANGLLWLCGVRTSSAGGQDLNAEELRTVLMEAGAMIPKRHQKMLLSILDLQKATVEDIMVPRNEISGIDISDSWEEILSQLRSSQHTRLPVYEESIDSIIGMVHLRRILNRLALGKLDKESLVEMTRECYFVPEATPLNTCLLNFQRQQRRIGLVVDEYGDIQGLVTLEDILEEIVGEFTTDPAHAVRDVYPQEDGSFLVNATANVRSLNRSMGWDLPSSGPKTLNGLIIEHMETIPDPGTSIRIGDYAIEIIQTQGNAVKTVRVRPGAPAVRPPDRGAG